MLDDLGALAGLIGHAFSLWWIMIPAIVVGRGTAVIASNPLHRALTTNFSDLPAERRFYAYWLFADPSARAVPLDWVSSARETVGVLRASVTRFPQDQRLHDLVDELSTLSLEFRSLLDEHDFEEPSSGAKRYRHPVAGELTLLHEVAQLSDEHWLHLYWGEKGSESEGALDRLRAASAAAPPPAQIGAVSSMIVPMLSVMNAMRRPI